MATQMTQTLAACVLALAAASVCAAPAATDTTHPKATGKHKAKKAQAKPDAVLDANDAEPDITDTVTTDYRCELGNKVTIYTNDKDVNHIALRWKSRLHRLEKVGTTTGAQRFENKSFGLVWIGIPAKGILLDSKQNRQLANECKNAEQSKAVAAIAVEEKKG